MMLINAKEVLAPNKAATANVYKMPLFIAMHGID